MFQSRFEQKYVMQQFSITLRLGAFQKHRLSPLVPVLKHKGNAPSVVGSHVIALCC